MRKSVMFLLMIFIIIFIMPFSCVRPYPFSLELDSNISSHHSPTMVAPGSPEESYIHLIRIYEANIITGTRTLGVQTAGGVCVYSEVGGCYVVTVNHFCAERLNGIPNMSHFSFRETATNINGGSSSGVIIVDTMPEADLCLLYIRGDFTQARGIQLDANTQRFEHLQNYGAPAGFFMSNERWNLAMYEGRWSGYCNSRCAVPDDRVNMHNLINHTIPTTRGQSGSPIFIGDYLFGVQVASNPSIEDFGIAASSYSIYLLLERNGILLERHAGEE